MSPRQTAEYHRQWRKDHPELVAGHKARNAARKRALEDLRRQYPDEFRRLYMAELAELAAADGVR
jgi:hypothetical protein